MNLDALREIRKTAIMAMISDDYLMERLIFKGGNALDIIYKIAQRASIDIDCSISNDFEESELRDVEERIRRTLLITFSEHGYKAFDISFTQKPEMRSPNLDKRWGGYEIEFKLIEKGKAAKLGSDIEAQRRNALPIGPMQQRKFKIDISKYEYCTPHNTEQLEGLVIYVYTPVMLALEKLRAICQQTNEYHSLIKTHPRAPRARDFFDIYVICRAYSINIASPEHVELLKAIFAAKIVPLDLLLRIDADREFHRPDFDSVKSDIYANVEIFDYDFYFDFVVDKCRRLHTLGEV